MTDGGIGSTGPEGHGCDEGGCGGHAGGRGAPDWGGGYRGTIGEYSGWGGVPRVAEPIIIAPTPEGGTSTFATFPGFSSS